MKKLIILLILSLFLSGCATVDSTYYTNPNNSGYTQNVFSGLCENCNRIFLFSKQLYDSTENVQCCYCGHIQNLKMAYNRYTYLQQQQQEQKAELTVQQLFCGFNQSLQKAREESTARRQKAYEEYQQNLRELNRPGTAWNPIYVKERK